MLSENIKNLRKTKGISQEELAFSLSSARNYIGCIERGEKSPSLDFMLDISNVLGCNLAEFFKNV